MIKKNKIDEKTMLESQKSLRKNSDFEMSEKWMLEQSKKGRKLLARRISLDKMKNLAGNNIRHDRL